MQINVFTTADDTLVIALPTKTLMIDTNGFLRMEDYAKEGECRTTINDLRHCTAYDFINVIINDLKQIK